MTSLSPLDVQLNGTHIQQVQNYKYLGVEISDTLSWSQHIDLVRSKVAKGIGLLRRLSWFLPRQALCTMYNAYILPHLTYADAVRGTCTQGQSNSLEHLQNYAARTILHRRVATRSYGHLRPENRHMPYNVAALPNLQKALARKGARRTANELFPYSLSLMSYS